MKNINKIQNEGGEGEYKVPGEVYNANWRDDIAEQADSEKLDFETFDNEAKYKSPEIVDAETLKRIKSRQVGQRVLDLFSFRKAA
ncbi:hypothetical protein IJK16_01195 [Candidatus Saccharibacteria bacterium]|nr:hypothetical protein [Candidatus Saccharibacteria bacterium]